MAQVVASIDISAPPETVWEVMSDARRFPEYVVPTERMIQVPDEPMHVGYTYREYGGIRPFKSESRWRVVEFEPTDRQVHIGDDGMMNVDLVMELDRIESGTRYTQTLDLKPRWFLAPVNAILWPLMMRRRTQDAMDRTVKNLKEVVETSSR